VVLDFYVRLYEKFRTILVLVPHENETWNPVPGQVRLFEPNKIE
jgi:hypothetical protein